MSQRNGSPVKFKPPRVTANWVFNQLMTAHQAQVFQSRSEYLLSGRLDSPERDIDRDCGYPSSVDIQFYKTMYDRVGPASRSVNIWPDECWSDYPELVQNQSEKITPFERRWRDLEDVIYPWHWLHRGDRLSGIGQFGVLLLGIDDKRDFDDPVPGVNASNSGFDGSPRKQRELLYVRAFDETQVTINDYDTDKRSPRFGMPTEYTIQFASPATNIKEMHVEDQVVHWSRVLHLADNCHSSVVFGVPRLQNVINILLDIRKLAGSSAEMFWKGGFPGYQFVAMPDLAGQIFTNKTLIKQEVEAYTNGLQRYMTAVGGEWKSLAVQLADPSKHFDMQMQLLCATLQVPMRTFLGTESGHLASTQDAAAWNRRLDGRRKRYLEPSVVRPFIDRLMDIGILPRVKKYIINWPDLTTLSGTDRADVSLKQVQALMQYVTGNANMVMPRRLFLTQVMGFSEAMADAIERDLIANPPEPLIETPPVAPGSMGGTRLGNPARGGGAGGRPRNTPPEGQARPARTQPAR